MSFKKNKIKKTSPIIINVVWLISLLIIFSLWLLMIKNINFFNFKTKEINNTWSILIQKTNSWINIENNVKKTDKIINFIKKKNNKNKINILVVWRWWGDHDAPNLTDTIILISINTETKLISMLSIPRDLYVEYPNNSKSKKEAWKINWLYAKYSYDNNSRKIWMNTLKNKIIEVTWERIDYFINIDFNWFKNIIDTIWWIEITIPKQFVDNKYPDWNWWYKTLIFKKWTWIFDWENALKYARSRHSTSDFDRSIRQQQVIKSIKDKLTWSYFFKSPWKIRELYEVFIKYVYTDIKLSTLIKLAYTLNWASDYKIISSNLNDSCYYWSDSCEKGWFLYTPQRSLFWWMSVVLAEWTNIEKLSNYKKIQKYTNIVFNSPKLFEENYKINIFNSLKVNNLAWVLSNSIVRYWFNIPKYNSIWNTWEFHPKSVIYYNNISEESETIKILKSLTDVKFIKTEYPKYSKDKAKIEIIIWEDYLSDKNPFNF